MVKRVIANGKEVVFNFAGVNEYRQYLEASEKLAQCFGFSFDEFQDKASSEQFHEFIRVRNSVLL